MSPDFSPGALALFLHGSVIRAGLEASFMEPKNKLSGERAERRRIRKVARIESHDFDIALKGRMKHGATRARLWAAVGFVVGDLGVMLLDDGGQEEVT